MKRPGSGARQLRFARGAGRVVYFAAFEPSEQQPAAQMADKLELGPFGTAERKEAAPWPA